MPAEIAKTVSFVNMRFMPTVAHAAGLSFIASRRRPNGPRRSHTTKIAQQRERGCEQHELLGIAAVERCTRTLEPVTLSDRLEE